MKNPFPIFNELFYVDTENDYDVYRCVTDGVKKDLKILKLKGSRESGIFASMALRMYYQGTKDRNAETALEKLEHDMAIN